MYLNIPPFLTMTNNKSISAEKIIQINLHHAKAASASLEVNFVTGNFFAALIQEPYCINNIVKELNCGSLVFDTTANLNPRATILFRNDTKYITLS